MRRVVAGCLLLFLAPAFAGCIQESRDDVTVLWFEYTLAWHGPGDEHVGADPGAHCGLATRNGDLLRLERSHWETIGKPDHLVVVDATLSGPWATVGDAPLAYALPAKIDPRVNGTKTPIVALDWRHDTVWVDGSATDLPAEVAYTSPDDQWSANGTITQGPTRMRTFGPMVCD